MDWLNSARRAVPPVLAAVGMAAGLSLLLGDDHAARIGILDFRRVHHEILVAVLIISFAALVAHLAWRAFAGVRRGLQQTEEKRERMKLMSELKTEEKAILRTFMEHPDNTQHFSSEDPAVQSLEDKGVIYLASGVGSAAEGYTYHLHPWAREMLQAKPELLER